MAAGALDLTVTHKALGGRTVLADAALRIEPGEVVALMGPSGCGKTTLLRIAAGLDAAYRGHREAPDGALGMMFQEPRLLPWRTVLDNLMLCRPPGGEAAVRDLLDAVGLADSADMFPGHLSLGMQRRVALARAFAVEPALVLLDEPFASLDRDNVERLRALVATLLERRPAATLLVTHDAADAAALADRILHLSGAPATLAPPYAPALRRSSPR